MFDGGSDGVAEGHGEKMVKVEKEEEVERDREERMRSMMS
jgi:hypothetical protein